MVDDGTDDAQTDDGSATGQSSGDTPTSVSTEPPPATTPSLPTADEIEIGTHAILTIMEAGAIIADAEIVLTFIEPINAGLTVITSAAAVWHALEASVRAYGSMGYAYGLGYGAMNLGDAAYPDGPNSLDSEDTIRDKKASFSQGAMKAADQLADGTGGVALKNRILVRSAYLQNDPGKTINEIWLRCF